jgi:hypothetical protein
MAVAPQCRQRDVSFSFAAFGIHDRCLRDPDGLGKLACGHT